MAAAEKVNWPTYALDLISRLREHDIGSPTIAVVGILGYVVENDVPGVEEDEREMARAWLARLVDREGNPLDDKLRDVFEHVAQENLLEANGQMSFILREDDRVTATTVVSRRAAKLDRQILREKLVANAETYVDHLLDALYEEPTS